MLLMSRNHPWHLRSWSTGLRLRMQVVEELDLLIRGERHPHRSHLNALRSAYASVMVKD